MPEVGESKSGVEGNVASADEESGGRAEDKANGSNCSVVEDLVSDHGVHEQDPEGSDNRSNVDCRESYPYGAREREPANGEDLANRNDNVAEEEELHFPVRVLARIGLDCQCKWANSYLLPTAARFMFDRMIR